MSAQLPARIIKWENGNPVPAEREPIKANKVVSVMQAAMQTVYKPKTEEIWNRETEKYETKMLPGEEDYVGMTCLEVMSLRSAQLAAEGDLEREKHFYDRVVGKSKQITENLNINADLSLQGALDQLANKAKEYMNKKHIIDAQFVDLTKKRDMLEDL